MKLFPTLCVFSLTALLHGCAISSGLHSYDLPDQGYYQTDSGVAVNIIPLTQDAIRQISSSSALQDYQHLFNTQPKNYRLSSGDILSIYLWAYPELTPPTNNVSNFSAIQANGYQIDSQGYIQFPIIGRYQARGKTIQQVHQELRSLLARYLKTPDVVVRVLSYQSQRYSVQGQVKQPGEFTLNDQPTSVYTALSLAGGFYHPSGNTSSSMTLIRQGQHYPLNPYLLEKAGWSLHQLFLQPNDTLYVSARENQKVYIIGEAGKNQSLEIRSQGINLADALGESQGINPLAASASKIYVLRHTPTQEIQNIYHLDLSSLANFTLAQQFQMQANDIVYVDSSGLARWQRVVNQIIPFSNIIYNFDRLGQ